ncbi:unnamed protein product [Effrenium voratum]|uniref:Uncharacterized protein n=1 Tax=Effrenium voratum TaxID=2562239 RepID=A0AA36J294_9DINO|nr:unnamed protein product [Effrenium voratum]
MKRGFPRSDAAAARRDTGEKVFSGVVRSIDLERHSALIDCPAVARQSGKAVVAGLPLLRDTLAGPGDTVAFFIDWVKGTQASAPMLRLSSQDGMALMGKFRTGTVGYGFVACEEVKDFFGRDPYVKPDLADTFTTGQTVCFNVTINAQGVPTVSEMAECQPDWQPMPSEILGEVDEALDAEPLPPRLATPASRVIPPRPRPTPSASKSGLAAAVAAFAAAAPTLAPRPRAAPAADAADAVAPCAGNWQWGNSGQPEPQSEGQAQQEPQDESQAEWQGGQSAWNNHGAWNSEGGQGMWKDEPGDQTMWNSQGAQSEAAHPEPQEPGYQALHATPQAASARPAPSHSGLATAALAALAAAAATAPAVAPPHTAPAADAADAVAPSAGNWHWGNSNQPEPQSEGQAQQEPQDESQAQWQGGQSAWNNNGAWNSEGGQGMWKDEPGDQTMWNSQGDQSEGFHAEPQALGYQALHATPQADSARPAPSHSGLATAALAALAAAAAAAPAVAPPHTAPAADAADAVAPSAGNWHWGNSNQPEPQSEGQAQQEPQDESQAEWQGGQSAWNNNGAWNSKGGQGMWKDEQGDQTMWNSQGAQSEVFHPEPQALGYQASVAKPRATGRVVPPRPRPVPAQSESQGAAQGDQGEQSSWNANCQQGNHIDQSMWNATGKQGDHIDQSMWNTTGQQGDQSDQSMCNATGQQGDQSNQSMYNATGQQGEQSMWIPQGEQDDPSSRNAKGQQGAQDDQSMWGAAGQQGDQSDQRMWNATGQQGDQSKWNATGQQGDQSMWNANGQHGAHSDQSMWNATGQQGEQGEQSDQSSWNATGQQGDQSMWNSQGEQSDQSSWNAKGTQDDQSLWNAKATQGDQDDQSSWWNSKGDQDWWQRDKASQGSWDWSWGKDTEPEPGSKAWRELRDSDLAGAQKKREAGATCALGVVASYIPEKKCGFIECDSVKASLGQQVFIYGDIMTRGLAGPGDLVAFFLHMSSKGKAQASHPLLRLATGVDGTYALKGTFQAASGLSRACVVCEEIRKFFGCEACVHEALAAQLGPDTVVSFNVILNAEGQPEVHDAVPCGDAWQPQPTVMDQAARGMPHPAAESAPAEAEAPKLGGVPEPALPPKAKKAMPLAFQTGASGKGKGGKGGNGGNKGDLDGAWLVGRVKSYSDVNKYGFIESDAVKAACGGDIFMPAIQFVDKGIRIGDTVQVQVKINQKGKPQANQVLPAT